MNELTLVDNQTIHDKIYTIRGMQVMLDSDLAQLYEVETKAVNRNIARFPEKFRFQLTKDEYENLRSQFVTLSLDKGWGNTYPMSSQSKGYLYMMKTLTNSIKI